MIWKKIKSAVKRELKQQISNSQWYASDIKYTLAKDRKKLLIKKGFCPSANHVYDFDQFGFDAFLDDRDYAKMYPINNPIISQLIDSKSHLPLILADRKFWCPDLYVFTSKGRILYQRGLDQMITETKLLIEAALDKFGKLIVKPLNSGGGRGMFILTKENLDSKIDLISRQDLVLNCVLKNDSFLSEIYPNSLNTTRVIFFKNRFGKNEILMLAQRFGTSMATDIDNVSGGGMGCSIDPNTGEMSKAYTLNDKSTSWHSHHFDTNKPIEGVKIPDWSNKFRQIQEIVDYLEFLEYAGLDIAFTDQGIKIVEINSQPGSRLMQVGGPALLNSNFKEFLEGKGYRRKA